MNVQILRLDKSGFPLSWLSREDAATLYVRERVTWVLGEPCIRLRGGMNRQGQQSVLDLAPIIACDGTRGGERNVPALCNRLLFRRDGHLCLYCGKPFGDRELTRDHVQPRVMGGDDSWTNVVAACRRCNQHKGGRTPEQAGMDLLAIPFTPNRFEWMYLANRTIRGDQMEYLQARFSGKRSWLT
jgi:hypothetical protein